MDDKFQRFIEGEVARSHARRADVEEPQRRTRKEPVAIGSTDYKPYRYLIGGAESCRINWWDEQRGDRRGGTSFHYRTLVRIGWDEIEGSGGRMLMTLFLADVNYLIEGHHLWPLIDTLSHFECAEMNVYSPAVHRVPVGQLLTLGEPVLTRVQSSDGLLMTSQAVRN